MAMEVQKEKMHEDIVRKAANNKDKHISIRVNTDICETAMVLNYVVKI